MNTFYHHPFFTFNTIIVIMVLAAAFGAPAFCPAADSAGAKLDNSSFAAKGSNETLLHIEKPGCFCIRASSKQGTQLTFVDRMIGPYQSSGSPGVSDGRLDLILDKGSYKIRLLSHPNGSGKVKLEVFPYREAKDIPEITALPYLQNLELFRSSLDDLQHQAFWIHIKERQVLRLEALGRNLRNALLWREGSWLVKADPSISQFEPTPGQPMTHVEFHHDLNPGLYLLVCYGGPPLTWTKDSKEHPFYLRTGIPDLGQNGQHLMQVSPFGRDTFLVSGQTNFFQLVRQDKILTSLFTTYWGDTASRFASTYGRASITKESRDPWCFLRGSPGGDKQWVTVIAPPGDRLELDFFLQQYYYPLPYSGGDYWLSTIHSAQGRDAIDATALLACPDLPKPIEAAVIKVSPSEPLVRKVNLLESMTVFLFIEDEGTYTIEEDPDAGAKGSYQLQRFMMRIPQGYQAPPFQDAGTDFEATAGYHVLAVSPIQKGILHFAFYKKSSWGGWQPQPIKDGASELVKPSGAKHNVVWPLVTIPPSPYHEDYHFILNRQGGVDTGFIVRPLPMNLADPLPVPLEPHQSVIIRVKHLDPMRLMINGGNFRLLVDGAPWDTTSALPPGLHQLDLKNLDNSTRLFNVKAEVAVPYSPPPRPVLEKIENIFPILTEQKPLFRDFAQGEAKEFLLQVKEPGLYRLETTGRMATQITVRTPTTTSLFSAEQNGIGRNALVQQFLKPGNYLVQAKTLGKSRGRAGIVLRRTGIDDIPGLSDGKIKRTAVPPDAAVRFEVPISDPGKFFLDTFSLGKPLTSRFDDHDGWPLLAPGKTGPVELFLDKGSYFYYSLPQPVESRRVTFLNRIQDPRVISGKGPHILFLNQPLENTWLEDPKGAPDIYHITISDPIQAELTITGDLEAVVSASDGSRWAATSKGKWDGELPPGSYRIAAKHPEKNNRVPYSLALSTYNLIPGLTQPINGLPAYMTVSLAKDGPVEIFSFGDMDVKAVLKDKDGLAVIAAEDDMARDWNFKISRNLKAGQYRLEVSSALAGAPVRPLEIRMQRRDTLEMPAQSLPFSIKKSLKQEVLKIPLKPRGAGSLLSHAALAPSSIKSFTGVKPRGAGSPLVKNYKLQITNYKQITNHNVQNYKPNGIQASRQYHSDSPQSPKLVPLVAEGIYLLKVNIHAPTGLKVALMRGDVVLAEGLDRLYIPLPEKQEYTLLAWALDEDPGDIRIEAEAVSPQKIPLSQSRQSFPIGAGVQIHNRTGLSFRLKSIGGKEDKFYYSPAPGRPCLLVGQEIEGCLDSDGWLVSSNPGCQVQVDTADLENGQSYVVFNDLPLIFSINHTQDLPLLLEMKSIDALMGAAVFPVSPQSERENPYRHSGMLATNARTLAGFPGRGQYRIRTWLTKPTPLLTSEENRFYSGERVTLSLTAYPKQEEIDFKEIPSVEAGVAPGQSVWLRLNEEPQLLELILAHKLVAFSRHRGQPDAMAAALDKNTQIPLAVNGDLLYILNTGDVPARFRVEKKGTPPPDFNSFNPAKGLEEIYLTQGTLSLQLPNIPPGYKLYVAGSQVKSRVWGENGKIVSGSSLTLEKNLDMEYYEVPGGYLEIFHGPGLVKVWQAPAGDNGISITGDKTAAVDADFKDGSGMLSRDLQQWDFSLDEPQFISIDTWTPSIMALVSGEEILCLSASPFPALHRVNRFLPKGSYRVLTRPLPGVSGKTGAPTPGPITLNTLSPSSLDVPLEHQRLIQPGEIQVYRFSVEIEGNVGVGLVTESDSLDAQLLDENSKFIASGPLMIKELPPGPYLLVVMAHDIPVQYKPLILGHKGSRQGVPEEILEQFKKEIGQ